MSSAQIMTRYRLACDGIIVGDLATVDDVMAAAERVAGCALEWYCDETRPRTIVTTNARQRYEISVIPWEQRRPIIQQAGQDKYLSWRG